MVSAPCEALGKRARRMAARIGGSASAVESRSAIGGGSLPGQTQPSWAVALQADSPDRLAATLRRADPPVISRIEGDRVLLDLRAILPEQDAVLAATVAHQR